MRDDQDPIEQVRKRLIGQHGVDEDELKSVDARVRAAVGLAPSR